MKISGIIAEYNPFHYGHKYQIEMTRQNGATHIVAVMSGNFVQRGECAIAEKHTRTRMALENGVDLVLEIPVAYASANAQTFAGAAVSILDSLGSVEELSFGSESGDIEALKEISRFTHSKEVVQSLREGLNKGLAFAMARSKAFESVLGQEKAKILSNPNDTLGVEYIEALNRINSKIEPFAVKRLGTAHDSNDESDRFCSASQIRKKLIDGDESNQFIPSYEILKFDIDSGAAPIDFKSLQTSALCRLRSMSPNEISKSPDISEGIENRIFNAVRTATSFDELYASAKTKRYSHARIRRIVLHSFLGITQDDNRNLPPYIKVLGMNDRGAEILKKTKKSATLPIVMRAADINALDDFSKRAYELECMTTDIFAMAMPKPRPCGMEQMGNAIIIK